MKCVDTNQCQTLRNRAFSVNFCPSVPYHQSPIMGTNLDEKRNYFQTQMYNRIRVGFLQVDLRLCLSQPLQIPAKLLQHWNMIGKTELLQMASCHIHWSILCAKSCRDCTKMYLVL